MSLIGVFNFPKKWVADYQGVFRILSNIYNGVFYEKSCLLAVLQNTSSCMFDRVLNVHLDYVSCFAMVLKRDT